MDFYASLLLPVRTPDQERRAQINSVLESMQMDHALSTRVGGLDRNFCTMVKGVSKSLSSFYGRAPETMPEKGDAPTTVSCRSFKGTL